MMSVLIKANDLSKTFGKKFLFENINFQVNNDDCIGLIGPNGCGKTTLFNLILGAIHPSSGDIWKKDNIDIRYLEQVAINPNDKKIIDFFNRTTQPKIIQRRLEEYKKKLEDPKIYDTNEFEIIIENIKKLEIQLNQKSNNKRLNETIALLEELELENLDINSDITILSGGERQKIALASIFAQSKDCDILLLDEPTNHLDIQTIEWIENKIADFPGAIMMISHDRYLLDVLVDRIFDFQDESIDLYNTTFQEYEEEKKLRQNIKQKTIKKTNLKIKQQKKVIENMTRRNRYDKQLTSKIKQLEKKDRIKNPVLNNYLLKFNFRDVFKSGKNVADGTNLSKKFDEKIILDNVNFEILAGQKIGFIGPNGCGKTTFLKMLIGKIKPENGSLHVSSGVKIGYFDQGHLSLKHDNTMIEEVQRGHKDISENDAKALLGQFNFKGDIINNKIKMLSGGERARIAILRLIMQPYNFIVLDEPTNHMDITSKTAIESAINTYNGTVLIVSHDRRFLDNATDTIFFMNNSKIMKYKGNYSNFKLQRQQELIRESNARHKPVSIPGTTQYVVCKTFTNWTTKTKHKIGENIFIGDHNKDIYEYAIKGNMIKPAKSKRK